MKGLLHTAGRITTLLSLFIFLQFLFITSAYSQDCNITSKANDILPDKLCAPVTLSWEVTYRGVNNSGTPVDIVFNWDDGNPVEVVPAVNTNPNPLIREWSVTVTHVYPQNGPLCNYRPTATLRVNGVLCTSSIQQQNVTVWDTDDMNGGDIAIDPQVFPICLGNDGGTVFTDVSIWNCVPPVEIDNPNHPTRWTQWIYGTAYTINNIEVNGVVQTYPYYGAVVPAVGPVYAPQPPNNVSLPVYCPNTALLGQFFEVTLRNWNLCNPYDDPLIPGPPADPLNGDWPPVISTAMIIIVPYPDATITPAGPFCSNAPATNLSAATPGGVWTGTGITNATAGTFNPGTAGPGTHTITYTVVDGNGCIGIDTENIVVWARPTINILPGSNLQVCPGDDLFLDGNPTPGSGPIVTHLWTGSTGPLSATNIQNPVFNTSTPGTYNLTYRVTDANGCTRSANVTVNVAMVQANILPDPANACIGTDFQLFGNPSGGSGTYTTHVWSGSTGPLNSTTVQNPIFNASTTGAFTLNYLVTDNNGCTGTDNITVNVYNVPAAIAGPDDSICGLNFTMNASPSLGTGNWAQISGPGTSGFSSNSSPTATVTASLYGTYSYTWTEIYSPGNCTDKDTVVITFVEQPNPYAGPDGNICGLAYPLNGTASVGTGSWSQISGPGTATFGNASLPATTVSVTTYGLYSFVWFEDNGNNCEAGDTINIGFDLVPIPGFLPADTSGCPPFSVPFTNTSSGGVSWAWSFGDGGTATTASPVHVYGNTGTSDVTHTVKLVATSTFGCKDSVTHTVTVHPLPVSNFLHDGVPSCSPVTVNFTNYSSGAINYIWDYGDGSPQETGTNTTHTFINQGTLIQYYEVRLIAITAFGCADTSIRYVTVFPDPVYVITAVPDSACHPANIQFQTQPGASSYDWSFGDGTFAAAGNVVNHPYINSGTIDSVYHIRLIGTSFFGCIDTAYADVIIHPSPQAVFSIISGQGCSPHNAIFNNASTGSQQCLWNFGDGNSQSACNTIMNHTYINTTNLPQTFSVSLIVLNNAGCSDTTSHLITIYPPVTAAFTCDTVGCSPFLVNFQNQTMGATSYQWLFGDGTNSTDAQPIHAYINTNSAPQSFMVQLTASSQYGCSDTLSRIIKVNPSPNAELAVAVSAGCTPFNAQLLNSSTGASSFFWYFGDGTTGNSPNAIVPHNYINTLSTPASFTASLAVSNNYNCRDSAVVTVSVYPEVQAFYTSDTAGCSPITINFNNLSLGASGYQWSFGDGNSSSMTSPSHTYTNTTPYTQVLTALLTATSIYGCNDIFSRNISVYPSPEANFTALPAVQTWPAATISIDNTSTPAGAWTYLWQFGDGNISSVAEPNSHTYASWGTYTVQLTVSSPYCADSASNSIEIIAPAAIAFFEVNAAGCAPLSVEFVNQSQFATSYLWSFGDSSYSNLEHPEHTYFEAGSFYVQLVATGPGGQDVYGGGTVNVYEVPTAMFTVSPTVVFLPDQPIHCTNNTLNGNSFYWDFGDGSTSTEANPNHYYNQEGEFTIMLIANTIHNCKDTFTVYRAVVAEASGEIDFPSAFTPNPNGPNGGTYQQGDVNNDVFHPVFVGVEEYNLTIFNRWGEMIFESKDPNIGWDGYYRGEMCKQDVYVWKAKGKFLDGQSFFQAGDVTLLR